MRLALLKQLVDVVLIAVGIHTLRAAAPSHNGTFVGWVPNKSVLLALKASS